MSVLLATTFDAYGVEAIEGEPHYHKHIRNIAINWACQAHLESCINGTRDKFADFMENRIAGFSSDHEEALFCNGILMATEQEFSFMWNLYNSSTDALERRFYLSSMGCIENEDVLTRFINTILEVGVIDNTNNNEWLTIVQAVYRNGPIGLKVTLRFLRERFDDFIGL